MTMQFKKRFPVIGKAAVLAVFAAPLVVGHFSGMETGIIPVAHAEDGGKGGKGYMGGRDGEQRGQGGQGGHAGSAGSTGDVGTVLSDDGTDEGDGEPQRGPDETSDAKGPKARKPDEGTSGGKPVWAQEGIPEVELGRLNVARSPGHVLSQALSEAISGINSNDTLYTGTFDAANEAILDGTAVRIDSPLENLALYKELLVDGQIVLNDGGTPDDTSDDTVLSSSMSNLELAAIFLGGASDKTVEVTDDTVTAVNTILGVSMSDEDVSTLADLADQVRANILTEHGE